MMLLTIILQALFPIYLSMTQDGSLNLAYQYGEEVMYVTSHDDGKTWSQAVKADYVPSRHLPVFLRSGMLVRPVQKEDCVGIEASMDRGKSWMPFGGTVRLEEKIYDGKNRPQIIPYRDGRLALLLSAHGYEWRYKSVSSDFGQTWSAPEPWVYSPFQDSYVTILPNGKWLMVKNGRIDQQLFYLPDQIYAYLSDDEGRTWYGGLRIDARMDAVSPVVCAPGNGSIYIAWAMAPENGREAKLCLARTGEVEISKSSITDAVHVRDTSTILTIAQASENYGKWCHEVTRSDKSWAAKPLRVATYNIEYRHVDPKRPDWDARLPYVNWLVRHYDFDVFGVQEPFEPEYQDLVKLFEDGYSSIFASTNLTKPDFSNSIFWKRSRVEKLDDGIFWYTENPGQTRGFGGASSRLCIWAKFKDKETGKIFFHFNSHYDFTSNEAMLVSSRLLLAKIREIAGTYPVFCTGDFNCSDGNPALNEIENSGFMADAKKVAEKSENAEYSSMRRYADNVKKNGYQLDHIYVTGGSTKVHYWKLIMDDHDGMKGGSDHLPIFIDWTISN